MISREEIRLDCLRIHKKNYLERAFHSTIRKQSKIVSEQFQRSYKCILIINEMSKPKSNFKNQYLATLVGKYVTKAH